jgi:hypothetical protein
MNSEDMIWMEAMIRKVIREELESRFGALPVLKCDHSWTYNYGTSSYRTCTKCGRFELVPGPQSLPGTMA